MTTPTSPTGETATVDPGDRGKLTIGRSVIRKVAEHAADAVPGTARTRRHIAGIGLSEQGPSVKVSHSGAHVDLTLDIALHYPGSVRAIVAAVREQVATEVERSTSRRVRTVDIKVSALLPDLPPRIH